MIIDLPYKLKKSLKYFGLKILTRPLIIKSRIREIANNEKLTLLNLHRVGKDDGSTYKPLDEETFIYLIEFLKANYLITSFSELNFNFNLNKNEISKEKPLLILSFDDGYKDFLDVVHPILLKNGIRANQNIIPSSVDSGRPPLNVLLEDYLGKVKREEVNKLRIPGYEFNSKLNIFKEGLKLSKFIKNKPNKIQKQIEVELFNQLGLELYSKSAPMMNIEDIKSIINHHDWGIHSYDHSNMHVESEDFFKKDLDLSISWFKNKLNINPEIYAFPNSSYKSRNIKLLKEYGFKNILLVGDKFSSLNENVNYRFGFEAENINEVLYNVAGKRSVI